MSFGRCRRPLVLTLDAFGTLFHPRQPIGQQYADTARTHGLSGFTHQDVEASFRKAFKYERQEHPNYGKAVGIDPSRWWANVIRSTFYALSPSSAPIPEGLVASLLHRFSSNEGYRMYDDVTPFFEQLREWRKDSSAARPGPPEIEIGIISNSDNRVPSILASLGISTSLRRYGSGIVESRDHSDIGWVLMSYDVGIEKPDRGIFDAARALSPSSTASEKLCLHIGDSIKEDYRGALEAGWDAVLLDRDGKHEGAVPEADRVTNLATLTHRLMHSK